MEGGRCAILEGSRHERRAAGPPGPAGGLRQGRSRGARAGWSRSAWRSSPPAAPPPLCARPASPVTPVEEVTGSPEMLDGRVKTLHPRIHGGILADRAEARARAQLAEHGIEPFDLVVVNLYPFRETVAAARRSTRSIEKIDIGGPAMVRAAAKNTARRRGGGPGAVRRDRGGARRTAGSSRATAGALAAEAYAHTAAYDAAIAAWFAGSRTAAGDDEPCPPFVGLAYEKRRRRSATERTRTSAARSTGRRPRRAARRRRGAPGQGAVVQQLAGCLRRATSWRRAIPEGAGGDRQAQQPVRRGRPRRRSPRRTGPAPRATT